MANNIFTLKNGIRVVHVPASGQVCYCGLIVNTGSRDEADDEYGMAHFVEHVVFKGTTHRKAYHILSRLDEVGGELNAYTTKEETAVHASFLERDFERASELIADMVFCSTFPERELAKEKEVIADEISSYRDTPSEMIFDEFEEQIFSSPALGHNILGSVESLSAFDADSVRRFMKRQYNTDQMVFSVWGNLDWNRVLRVARKYYEPVEENKRTCKRTPAGSYRLSSVTQNLNTNQCHVVLGGMAPDAYSPDRLPMYMLSNMLGGPCMNSRLSLLLREKNGIAYNVETSYTPFVDTGLFTIYFGTDAENLDRSLRIVNKELRLLCSQPLTEGRLSRLKRQFFGQLMMSADNGESQMLSTGRGVLLYNAIDDPVEVQRRIEAVTAADIMAVARRTIDPDVLSRRIYL